MITWSDSSLLLTAFFFLAAAALAVEAEAVQTFLVGFSLRLVWSPDLTEISAALTGP
jgi:hypothetical protein